MSDDEPLSRYSLAGLLSMITTFGVLFGALRLIGAPTSVYLYFGALAMSIFALQVTAGAASKIAAATLGGILLPCFLVLEAVWTDQALLATAIGIPFAFGVGVILGFCTSVLNTGVYNLVQMTGSFRGVRTRPRSAKSNGNGNE